MPMNKRESERKHTGLQPSIEGRTGFDFGAYSGVLTAYSERDHLDGSEAWDY